MGTKTVRLDDELYDRIRDENKDTETYSETIERLIGDVSLLDLAGNLSDEEATEAKDAVRQSREVGARKAREIGRQFNNQDNT